MVDKSMSVAALVSTLTVMSPVTLNRAARRVPRLSSAGVGAGTGWRGDTRTWLPSRDTTRISDCASVRSALMRLMRAVPRGVAAKRRSSMTTSGLRAAIVSNARSASASVKVRSSPSRPTARSLSAGSRSDAAIRTVQGPGNAWEGSLEDARVLNRPPADFDLADDVLLRHGAPVAAVGAVVAMIAHDEVVALLDDLRAPIVVTAELGG